MWLDLEEGILEEFSDRASLDAGEFATIGLAAGAMRTFRCQAQTRVVECSVCRATTDRAGGTCSKRCTQIRRRLDLIAASICIRCKTRPAREDAQACLKCEPPREPRRTKAGSSKTERCCGPECHNHVLLGVVGKPAKFCRDTCKNREMDRRKRERGKANTEPRSGDRVLVTSCSSDDPETRGARALFIGKRGRVVGNSGMLTVAFYGNNRKQFHANELLKLS